MSNIFLIAFWIDRPSTLFAVISYDMCTVCIIYLISYVFWFQNLHFQHIWKGKCYNKRSTAYFKKSAFPLMKPLHYFCLSNLFFWWNTIYRSVMPYLLLCLISKAQKTSRNLEEIITSTNKFAVPGTNIKVYSVHNAAGFWYNVCKDLQVPNTLTNHKKNLQTSLLLKVICYLVNLKVNNALVEHSITVISLENT